MNAVSPPRRVPLESIAVESPMEMTTGQRIENVVAVPVLRAGLGLLEGVLNMIPDVKVGFAGDTYNTAVYASRLLGRKNGVGFMTRIGADPLSSSFRSELEAEGIDDRHVTVDGAGDQHHQPGRAQIRLHTD